VRAPDWAADNRVRRWIFRAAMVLLVLGALAFVVEGANWPADPYLERPPADGPAPPGE
jgi:hypothetical protein